MSLNLAEARKQLAAALKAELGREWAIFPDARTLDKVAKPTLQLERSRIEPDPAAPLAYRLSTYVIYVIEPANGSDDALEGHVEAVLNALESATDITNYTAERGVWPAGAGTNPAYSISFTRRNPKE